MDKSDQSIIEGPQERTERDLNRNDLHRPATMRWVGILSRTVHIAVASVLFGGSVVLTPFASLLPWHHLTLASGCILVLLEFQHDHRWPHRGKGLLGILHISLAGLIHLVPHLTIPLLWTILITGCIGSHMPRRFRHWSLLDGEERLGANKR